MKEEGVEAPGAVLSELLVARMLETARALRAAYRINVDLTADERVEVVRQLATLQAQGQILMGHLHQAMQLIVKSHGKDANAAAHLLNVCAKEAHQETSAWLKRQLQLLQESATAEAEKPTEAETLYTSLPPPDYQIPGGGWYCKNHPEREWIANEARRERCWGCGSPRPPAPKLVLP